MPKAYEAKTLEKFGGLHYSGGTQLQHGAYSNADLKDEEAQVLSNFIFNDTGGLSKRHSAQTINATVTPTIAKPAGGALTAPATIRPIAIQRIQSQFNDRLYFTDNAKSNLWYTELTACSNSTTHILRQANANIIDTVEWMIPAATPTGIYQMAVCRSGGGQGGLLMVNDQGYAQNAITGAPYATHMTLFKDRIFSLNSLYTNTDESKLSYSDETLYTSWGANSFNRVGVSNADFLVATVVFNDTLIIFKSHSIWVLVADGAPSSWVYRNLHPSLGCAGRGTVQVIQGMVYFLGNDGVYRTDGTSFDKISEPIDGLLQYSTANPSDVLKREAHYFNKKYYLKTHDVNSKVFVFDVTHEAWSQWDFAGNIIFNGAQGYDDIITPYFYIGDGATNKIYQMGYDGPEQSNPWQDNGANYTCSWRSKRQTWGDPITMKRNYLFAMDVGHTSEATGTVKVTHKTDSDDLVEPMFNSVIISNGVNGSNNTSTLMRKELKTPGAGYGRAIETQIDYAAGGAFELYSVSWLNAVKDTIKKSN